MEKKPSIKAFVSYAHNDRPYFEVFLEGLNRFIKGSKKYNWEIWNDTNVYVGSIWDEEIQENLKRADMAILLVSDSFLASDYIEKKEFNSFLDRYYEEGVLIFPVLFAPCDFSKWSELAKRQFFMPSGSEYGRADLEVFTFADFFKLQPPGGKFILNDDIFRYLENLFDSLEHSVEKHRERIRKKHKRTKSPDIHDKKDLPNHINKSVPFYNINDLVDRKELLHDIHNTFEQSERIALINGIGGIGKTAIALTYANHPVYSKGYRQIAWVTVVSKIKNDLMQNLSSDEIGFKYDPELDEEINFKNFVRCMQKFRDDSLLIIDGADNPDEILQLKGDLYALRWNILITSRANPKCMPVFSVNELDNDNCRKLFLRYFKKATDNSILGKILKQIEHHTLLIVLLASAGNENPCLRDSEGIYHMLTNQGLAADDFQVNIPIGEKEDNLYRHINAIFKIKEMNDREQEYLRYFSVLPSKEIDIIDLLNFFQVEPDTRISFVNTLNGLVKKGWLINNRSTYKCHQLIQTVLRWKLKPDGDNCKVLIESLKNKLHWEHGDEETYVDKAKYLIYADTIWGLLEKENRYMADLGDEIAKDYTLIGNIRIAEEIIQKVVEIKSKIYPPNHPKLAYSLNNYSHTLWKCGNYRHAIKNSQLAIDIISQYPMEDYYVEYSNYYNIIALSERLIGSYQEAQKHFEFSIEILEKYLNRNLKKNRLRLSRNYNNLGWVYRSLENYEKTREYYEKALEIKERNLPNNHPSLALAYVNYAWILAKMKNYEGAQKLLQKALDIKKIHFEEGNVTFCNLYSNYAELCKETGELQKAKEYIHKAIDIQIKSGFEKHPTLRIYYHLLAEIEEKMGNCHEALKFAKLAVDLCESNFPNGHPDLVKYKKYYEEIKAKCLNKQ